MSAMSVLLVLDFVLKSLAIVMLAFASQALWRRASASQRCLIWLATFASLLALPLTLFIKPHWTPTITAPPALQVVPASQIVTMPPAAASSRASTSLKAENQAWWQHLSLLQMTGLCWLAGVLLVLGHRALGSWQLRSLRAKSPACEAPQVARQVAELARSLGIRRPITILTSTAMVVPVTWGVWRPVLLLPHQALNWDEETLHAALMHELGHIRHLDAAGRWLATVTCALQWWNPLAWAAARSWNSAQEQAADDLVLVSGSCRQNYAMQLLEAARAFQEGHLPRVSVLAMARPSTLETRLLAIMETGRNRRHASRKHLPAAAVAALLVMGAASSVSLQGQPAKAKAPSEPAKPERKQVGTVVKVLKGPADHFTGNPQISSGMILTALEAEEMLKAPGVTSESTPRVVTWDRQKVIIGDVFDEDQPNIFGGKKITLQPAINGEAVHIEVGFSIPEEAVEGGGPAIGGNHRTLNAAVDVPAGLTAVLVLPAVDRQPDMLLQISPVLLPAPPPWFSAEETAAKVILPQVRLANATVDEAIELLRTKAAELTPDRKGINLLNIGQPEARLSLDLKEVSLKEALGAIAKSANMDLQYDPSAIVLSPRGFLRPAVGLQAGSQETMVAAKASAIHLPQMDFRQAVFKDVVSFMREEVRRANPEEIRFDIVLDDESPAARKHITFHLQDISMLDLLHYVALLGDHSLAPEGKALVFRPAAR